ncbi:hypothetical protein MACH17_01970 [Phaeobacter inhibens]|nr:hypothetical protein MACH17_01970 [Phaeobacter inhibens]
MVFRISELLIRQRTQLINALRGHLAEVGQVVPKGASNASKLIAIVDNSESELPAEAIRAVEVTTRNVGDAPMLPDLLEQIPPDQEIATIIADGAYDTRKCHDAIAARNAHAVIPPRKNAKPWKPTSAGAIAHKSPVPVEVAATPIPISPTVEHQDITRASGRREGRRDDVVITADISPPTS